MKEELNDGRPEDSSGLNGDADEFSETNPLSIDIGESTSDEPQPSQQRGMLRINKLFQTQIGTQENRRRKAETNGVSGMPPRKVRATTEENEEAITKLESDIKALHWLARRKEQEWDQVIRLLKQKEEQLLIAQRNKKINGTETQHVISKNVPAIAVPPVVRAAVTGAVVAAVRAPVAAAPPPINGQMPIMLPQQQQVILLPKRPILLAPPRASTPVLPQQPQRTPLPENLTTIIQKASQNLEKAGGVRFDYVVPSVSLATVATPANNPMVTGAAAVLTATNKPALANGHQASTSQQAISATAAGPQVAVVSAQPAPNQPADKVSAVAVKTPKCQGCKAKKSEFVCAGCSNRWYCSRECQIKDWDEHADDCSG